MAAVAQKVADGNILRLIEKFVRSGVMENGAFKPTTVGTPQGGVLSPLLANIVLNHMDWQLEQLGWRFVRYADDFVLVCLTPAKAKRLWQTCSKSSKSWASSSVRRKPGSPPMARVTPSWGSGSPHARGECAQVIAEI